MFPVGHAVTVAVSVGHTPITPSGGVTRAALFPPQQPHQPPQGQAAQGQGGRHGEHHVQQEVLADGHVIDGRAQVVGAAVAEDVADPVDGPAHRVARLVLVDAGEEVGLLAVSVPGQTDRGWE